MKTLALLTIVALAGCVSDPSLRSPASPAPAATRHVITPDGATWLVHPDGVWECVVGPEEPAPLSA